MSSLRSRLLVILAFIAFISLGLPDTVLGVAWPSIRSTFHRPLGQLGLLLAGGSIGYLASSFLGGQIMRTVGVGKLLVGSSLLVTLALVGNALAPAWFWMILFAVIGGLGAGAIDAGINTFAATRFSPRIVNWLHAFWGVGATAGPLLMTTILTCHLGWRIGYVVLAAMLATLSVFFLFTIHLWQIDAPSPSAPPTESDTATIFEAIRQPVVIMQVLLFFVYAGVESTAGALLYSLLTEARGVSVATAGYTVSAYWGALTTGRIIFGQLAVRLPRRTVLRIGLSLAPLAAALIAWAPTPSVGLIGAVLLGFALAPVYPTLISITPEHVGSYHAPQSVGFQVSAATAGIMVFPGTVGLLARHLGLEVVCLYLLAASIALLLLHEASLHLRPPHPRPPSPTPIPPLSLRSAEK